MAKVRACNVGPTPETSNLAIESALLKHMGVAGVDDAFSYGTYGKKARSMAACAQGLLRLKTLIIPLFAAQPAGRFPPTQLAEVIACIVEEHPAANKSSFSTAHFSKWASTQIGVVLAHVRRNTQSTVRYSEAVSQLKDPIDRAAFDQMLQDCRRGHDDGTTDASPPKRRRLQAQVSIDGDGFPCLSCLDDDDVDRASLELDLEDQQGEDKDDAISWYQQGEAENDQQGEAEEEGLLGEEDGGEEEEPSSPTTPACNADPDPATSSPTPQLDPDLLLRTLVQMSDDSRVLQYMHPTDKLLAEAQEVAKVPVPPARGAQKQLALLKKPAAGPGLASTMDSSRGESTGIGSIKVERYSQKSYIKKQQDKKWVHILTVTAKQCAEHQAIVLKLFNYAVRHAIDKPNLVLLKNKWLADFATGGEIDDIDSECELEETC